MTEGARHRGDYGVVVSNLAIHNIPSRDGRRRAPGWRMWYGGPWAATRLVTATKPG